MAKTNPIGVRFDVELWDKFNKMGINSAQKILNFLEVWYIDNLDKVVNANNQPEYMTLAESFRFHQKQKRAKAVKVISAKIVKEDNKPVAKAVLEMHEAKPPSRRNYQKPERKKGEDAFEYAFRVNEWKKQNK